MRAEEKKKRMQRELLRETFQLGITLDKVGTGELVSEAISKSIAEELRVPVALVARWR